MRPIHDLRLAAAAALLGLLAVVVPAPAAAIDPSYSGSWYNPPESGSGFNLEIFEDDRALLFWYTYDDAGDAVWLYSEGAIEGDTIEFDTYFAEGMTFGDLDTADKVNRPWGTVTMTFADCDNATISYQSTLTGEGHSPIGTRTHPVEKLVDIRTLECRPPMDGYWSGRTYSLDADVGRSPPWVDVSGVIATGTMYLYSAETNELIIGHASADYWIDGGYSLTVIDIDTRSAIDFQGPAMFRARDFIRSVPFEDEYGGDDTWPLELTYRSLSDRDVTPESLEGDWTYSLDGVQYLLTILDDEKATAVGSNGCTYAGTFGRWSGGGPNAFRIQIHTDCGEGDSLSGVAVNIDVHAGDRAALEFFIGTDAISAEHFVAVRE